MNRWFLFIVTLILISTLAVAQAVITPSGQATQQGAAVPMVPASPPLVTTPLMHLGNARTTPGTSTAAITSTSPALEPPSAVPIRPEIDFGPQVVYVGPPNPNAESNNATAAPNAANAVTGRQMVDLGVHSDTAMMADDGTHGRSLGDIARDNRQRMQGANARNFTNADVQRMAGAGGVSGIATNPANNSGYPADNGIINSNGVAGQNAVASPTNTPPVNDQNAQPASPVVTSPALNEKPTAGTPPPNMAQAQTPANPADQNAAPANNEQRTLPKSASPLPLLALIGFTATIAGLLARKARA
jgi:hypothetical protein